ncbi:RHS repeat domain-containing protein [Flavobacterium sp. 3-218]
MHRSNKKKNSQKNSSKLADFDSYGADPRRLEKAGESFSGVKVNYETKYKKSLEVVKNNYASFEVPYYGLDNNDYVNGVGFCCNPSGEAASSSSATGKFSATAKNDNAELQQFYYHPDHLGSSSYLTNLDGEVVQHVEYVPFGEVFLEEKNAKWNTPYLFTSKELDKETGMYYFGARYQDPKLGIFISVDPLSEKYAGWSSYAYCANNPINMVDPDGKDWYRNDKNGKIAWYDGRSTIKGYTSLGYSYSNQSYGVNKNDHLIMDGETKTITINGTTIADFNKKGSNYEYGGLAISDGGNFQNPSSLEHSSRSVEWFDFNGSLNAILIYLSLDKDLFKRNNGNGKGSNGGRTTLETRSGNIIDAANNGADAVKEIKVIVEKYSTTGTLRGNASQVHKTEKDSTVDSQVEATKIFDRNNQRRVKAEAKANKENESYK